MHQSIARIENASREKFRMRLVTLSCGHSKRITARQVSKVKKRKSKVECLDCPEEK